MLTELFTRNRHGNVLQGATAQDTIEGDVTARVTACSYTSRFSSRGLLACDFSTTEPGNVTLAFYAADSTVPGGFASVTRTLVIARTCPEGMELCTDNTCQLTGLCATGRLQQQRNSPPQMRLPQGAAATVPVMSGQVYRACSPADSGMICESGVVAVDDEDGDLSARVLSCPPASCLAFGCPGHEFAVKGADLEPCTCT